MTYFPCVARTYQNNEVKDLHVLFLLFRTLNIMPII